MNRRFSTAALAALALAAVPAAGCVDPRPERTQGLSPVRLVHAGDMSRVGERRVVLVRSERAWRATWGTLVSAPGEAAPLPVVDFSTHVLVAAFSGTASSDGPRLSFLGYRVRGDTSIVLLCAWTSAASDGAQDVLYPVAVAAIPRRSGPVLHLVRNTHHPC